jgi:ribose transport system substrate-binding protein
MKHRITRLAAVAAAGALAVGLSLTGCSTTAQNGSGSGDGAAAAKNLTDFTANAKKLVEDATAKQDNKPPATGPKAVTGKKIFIIACAMAAEGCSRPAKAVEAAAKAIGWDATINDPQGDPSKMANAVNQAVASKYDAIALTAIDAQTIQQPLQQAKDAGLLIATIAGTDIPGKPMFDAVVPPEKDFVNQGYVTAAKAFLDHGSKLKLAMLTGTEFGTVRERVEGTKQFVADCKKAGGDCEIVAEENFLVTDLTTSLPGQAAAMIRSHTDADALWVGYDAGANFAIEGLESAGLKVDVYSYDGNVANISRIAKGDMEVSDAATAMQWSGYGVIDNFNRIWSKEKAVDQGLSFKLLTKDNVADGSAWDGDIDVSADYKKIWGVS